jgi:hypothetical protein
MVPVTLSVVRVGLPAAGSKMEESCVTPPGRMMGYAPVRAAMFYPRRQYKLLSLLFSFVD